jgi:hypothetical protein
MGIGAPAVLVPEATTNFDDALEAREDNRVSPEVREREAYTEAKPWIIPPNQ